MSHTCRCGKTYSASQAFFRHLAQCKRHEVDEQSNACVEMEEDVTNSSLVDGADVALGLSSTLSAGLEADILNIRTSFVEEMGKLRYEGFVRKAHCQAAKEAFRKVISMQTNAIRRELRRHAGNTNGEVESIVEIVMRALEPLWGSRAEEHARLSRTRYPITPQRRVLGMVTEDFERDDGTIGKRDVQVCTYDIPLDQVLQRHLHYDSTFREHFQDWGAQRSVGDELASVQDGAAAKDHPELGRRDYDGPDRLGFAYYVDDVEVCNPIGAARGKHKVMLQYVQLLNQPDHARSHLGNILCSLESPFASH